MKFGPLNVKVPHVETEAELSAEIKARREYLDGRMVPRTENPQIRRLASYGVDTYIMYQPLDGRKGFIVRGLSVAYHARSPAEVRKVVEFCEELRQLLRLAELNDWRKEGW